jgi:hypothetical protein
MASPSHFVSERPIDNEVKRLFDYAQGLKRGEVISHRKIEEITAIHRFDEDGCPNSVYVRLIRKWRKRMLREQKPWPTNVKDVGYLLPTVDQQLVQVPDAIERHTGRMTHRIHDIVSKIPVEEMDESQQQLSRLRTEQAREVGTLQRRHRAERHSRLAQPDTLPRNSGH